MKISNTTQKLAQEELRRDELKKQDNKVKQTQAAQKSAVASSVGKSADTSEMSNNPLAQDIKRINSDIGKLQVAQKSLKSIEPDAKKILELSKDYEESLDKTEQSSIKEEISILKKGIESILKGATFEGSSVFNKNIKDNKERVIFDAQKLDTKLINNDAQKFYDVLKEQQSQIQDAIQTLQGQAQESTGKLASKDIKIDKNHSTESTDGSFLKKFSSLFRASHNAEKLNNQRVQELLA